MKTNMASNEDEFKHSIEDHRKKVSSLEPKLSEPIYYERHIPMKISSNESLLVSIYRPNNINAPYPTIFYIPGTAFVANEFPFTALICTHIAKQSDCQVIVVRHRLAPEYRCPTARADVLLLLLKMIQCAKIFNIDKNKMVLIGYSSGGNLAASIAPLLNTRHLRLQRQILVSPIVDLSRSLKSHHEKENKDAVIKDNFVNWFLELALPKKSSPKHSLLSPMWNSLKQSRNSPPTDIFFGEYDRFRSDAEGYYLKLLQASVPAFRMMVNNEDHSFLWFKLHIAQMIGARIKVTLGLAAIPRPLLVVSPLCFFIKKQKKRQFLNNHDSNRLH